ncbi:MAG TPA: hypothetical protein VGX78_23070, partial [Pirellulales bacterium]|nr:hypothetical protein [Pirellulales bacterium]
MKNRESRPRRSKRPARRATHGPLPDWKAAERELWFRGHRLRQPGRKKAPLEEALFAALQRARWDDSVPNPYSGDGVNSDGDVLTEVVRRVNDSLEL